MIIQATTPLMRLRRSCILKSYQMKALLIAGASALVLAGAAGPVLAAEESSMVEELIVTAQ